MINQNHPYHIVFPRPWPLFTGITTLSTLVTTISWINTKNPYPFIINIRIIITCCFQWWRDVSNERSLLGLHTNLVINGLRWGIILFITSEILFFFSFFWAFFHRSLSPNLELGGIWPPIGIQAISPYQVPLLNTTVLLASGITVTLCHHALILKKNYNRNIFLLLTVLLGGYFTILQAWEYIEASFNLRDSCFGATFFLATGFHGLHVLIGTIFLLVSLARQHNNLISANHHLGTEIAIWYWHFVDVVWLFLYRFLYWWAY